MNKKLKKDLSKLVLRWRVHAAQQHYTTLLRLKQYFPFSLIDAMGSLDECKAQIARELRYQSSLDLDESTCAVPSSSPVVHTTASRPGTLSCQPWLLLLP